GDVAKGIKSFKKGMAEDEEEAKPGQTIDHQPASTVNAKDTQNSSKA
ncbi:MAG: twin-arginine translocase TatA/TatE family subunit, partial [Pseudomonadota bacterium]